MAFRLLTSQLTIGVHDGLDGFTEAHARLIERAFLDVAPRQFLDVADPPLAHLLEHAGIAVFHTIHCRTGARAAVAVIAWQRRFPARGRCGRVFQLLINRQGQ